MTILDEPMMMIRALARVAQCEEIPAVRIVFDNPKDQAKFKLELIKKMKPADAVTAPIASKGGLDTFEVAGLQVDLSNRDRGARAACERIISVAEKALKDASGNRVAAADIIALRDATAALIKLVRG